MSPDQSHAPTARCRSCGQPAAGGWMECPDGICRDLILDEPSGFYVDDVVPPRFTLEPELADGRILCDPCDRKRSEEVRIL